MTYQIAQINIARMVSTLDDPVMHDFVANLDRINALAESAPGFVWRLKGDGNDATSLRPYEDDHIIVNMSVWETPQALFEYAYRSGHVELLRRRSEWFEKMTTPPFALWWIPAGHIPTIEEAKAKLALIEQHGSSPLAFTFKHQFTAEDMIAVQSK